MKYLLLSFSLLGILNSVSAQNGDPISRFDIRFGIADNNHFLKNQSISGNYHLEFNYNPTKTFSIGPYIGYGRSNTYRSLNLNESHTAQAYLYGINAYYHFSHRILNDDLQKKLDLYFKVRVGGLSYLPLREEEYITRFDHGVYVGAAYYPWKRVGFNAELGFGDASSLKLGVVVRLGKLGN